MKRCAEGQRRFLEMHDKLFEAQGSSEDAIKRPALEKWPRTKG